MLEALKNRSWHTTVAIRARPRRAQTVPSVSMGLRCGEASGAS